MCITLKGIEDLKIFLAERKIILWSLFYKKKNMKHIYRKKQKEKLWNCWWRLFLFGITGHLYFILQLFSVFPQSFKSHLLYDKIIFKSASLSCLRAYSILVEEESKILQAEYTGVKKRKKWESHCIFERLILLCTVLGDKAGQCWVQIVEASECQTRTSNFRIFSGFWR